MKEELLKQAAELTSSVLKGQVTRAEADRVILFIVNNADAAGCGLEVWHALELVAAQW